MDAADRQLGFVVHAGRPRVAHAEQTAIGPPRCAQQNKRRSQGRWQGGSRVGRILTQLWRSSTRAAAAIGRLFERSEAGLEPPAADSDGIRGSCRAWETQRPPVCRSGRNFERILRDAEGLSSVVVGLSAVMVMSSSYRRSYRPDIHRIPSPGHGMSALARARASEAWPAGKAAATMLGWALTSAL